MSESGEVSMETMTDKENAVAAVKAIHPNAWYYRSEGLVMAGTNPDQDLGESWESAASKLPTVLAGACTGSMRVSNTTNGDDITVGCLFQQGHDGKCRFPSTAFQSTVLTGGTCKQSLQVAAGPEPAKAPEKEKLC